MDLRYDNGTPTGIILIVEVMPNDSLCKNGSEATN